MNPVMCWVDETDSTNQDLINWAISQAPGVWTQSRVLATSNQRRGRGRQGNAWHCVPDQTLCLSYVDHIPQTKAAWLGPMLAVAIVQAAQQYGLQLSLKWPNDVLSSDGARKLAGILIERAVRDAVVIGVGLNLLSAPVYDDSFFVSQGLPPIALHDLWQEQHGRQIDLPDDWSSCKAAAPWLAGVIQGVIANLRADAHQESAWFKAFQSYDHYHGRSVVVWDQGRVIQQGISHGIQSCGGYQVGDALIYAGHIRLLEAAL